MAQGTMNVGSATKPVFYGPTFVKTAGYPGAWLSDVVPNLKQAGAVVEAKQVQSVEDVVRLVDKNRGPVVFSVGWQSAAGIPGGGHTMMAYRPFFGSGVRLADQFGNMHTIKDMGQAGKFVIAGIDTTTIGLAGSAPLKAGDTIGRIGVVYKDAYIVRDAALLDVVANLPLTQRVGVPLYEVIDEAFWPKVGFAASMSSTAPPKLKKVGDQVRSAIAANPSGTPSGQQAGKTPSTASIPLSPRATRALSLLGPIGSKSDWKALRAKFASVGIATNDVYPAISELEGWGLITVERFGADTLNIISVSRN
jgi:hypothetical protein